MNQEKLKAALAGTAVTDWRYFASIGSTNTEALKWAETGAPDFSLIVANEQIKGRGRFDRRWVTLPDSSLAFSLVIRPGEQEKHHLPLFAPLCGIAVQQAVSRVLPLSPQIKWPNDVLIEGKKFCGILVESSWQGSRSGAVIMGIGINVNAGSVPPQELQSFPATSLQAVTGYPVDRFALLREVLMAITEWRPLIGTDVFLERWQQHLALKGQRVHIEYSEKAGIIGTIEGINHSGQLVLKDDSGKLITITIGDVHLRPEQPAYPGGNHA